MEAQLPRVGTWTLLALLWCAQQYCRNVVSGDRHRAVESGSTAVLVTTVVPARCWCLVTLAVMHV
jgi:hypothetical protein